MAEIERIGFDVAELYVKEGQKAHDLIVSLREGKFPEGGASIHVEGIDDQTPEGKALGTLRGVIHGFAARGEVPQRRLVAMLEAMARALLSDDYPEPAGPLGEIQGVELFFGGEDP